MRNWDRESGEIKDSGRAFEAQILSKDEFVVDRMSVDKRIGLMRSAC
jgi:hypothetical protein